MKRSQGFFKKKWMWLYGKIVHEKADPEYIARGWAIGMFYGLLIPFGFQLICSIPTALVMKGSKIGAVLGTLVTNHFTIFFIYPIQCYIGNLCMGGNLSYVRISEATNELIRHQSYQFMLSMGLELVASFFIGGALFALIGTPITYIGVKRLVIEYRRQIELRKAKKALKK